MPININKLRERLDKFELAHKGITKYTGKKSRGKKVVDHIVPIKKPEPRRMSYYTYAYLKSLVEREKDKLERDYHIALSFIPSEPFDPKLEGRTARDKAHKIFSDEHAKLTVVTEELHLAAQSMYKDHIRREMRQFWGLK